MIAPLGRGIAGCVAALAGLVVAAHAQDRLWTVSGANGSDEFGRLGVGVVGDLTGDGVGEVVTQNRYFTSRFHDGATGTQLFDYSYGIGFESDVPLRLGDVDADGVEDLLVPVWNSSQGKALVAVLSGATRAELYHRDGSVYFHVGDVDGDGADDFVVRYTDFLHSTVEVNVYSGASGTKLITVSPPGHSTGYAWGYAMAPAGDWNQDGVPDLAITDLPPPAGLASVLIASLKDGAVLATAPAAITMTSYYGLPLLAAGDLDQDGFVDFLAVNRNEDVGTLKQAGVVRVLSGATLTESGRFEGAAAYDWLDVNGRCGDVDGDGFEDFSLVTDLHSGSRAASWLYSGRLRSRLYAIQSLNPGDRYLVLTGADLDGDGLSEIVSGHGFDLGGRGTIAVDRGRLAFLALTPSFQRRRVAWSPSSTTFGWSLSCTANLADFQPGSVATIVLSELDGVPTNQVLAITTVDGLGSAEAPVLLLVTDILPHTVGIQAAGFAANGQAITTAIERARFL